MSLKAFQSALAELYLSPRAQRRFLADPRALPARRALSPREAGALAGIDRGRLREYCEGLALKNSSRLRSVFRRTAGLMGKRFWAVYEAYGDRHGGLLDWADKRDAFADLLLCELRRGEPARELARFECAVATLNDPPRPGAAPALARLGLEKRPAGRLRVAGRPLRIRAGFVGRFSCDVLNLAPGRATGSRKGKTAFTVLFYRRASGQPVQTAYLGSDQV